MLSNKVNIVDNFISISSYDNNYRVPQNETKHLVYIYYYDKIKFNNILLDSALLKVSVGILFVEYFIISTQVCIYLQINYKFLLVEISQKLFEIIGKTD